MVSLCLKNIMSNSSFSLELQEAVRKLEAFNLQNAETQASSPISKTIALMRAFLKDDQQDQNELRKAVEVIQRQRLFIQQLQNGNSVEKELAQAVNRAVTTYNARCKEINNSSTKGISKIFSKRKLAAEKILPAIDLPHSSTIKCHYPARKPSLAATHTLTANITLTKQSKELFQMKVLALLERYGIASNPEARSMVKQAPILTAKESDASTYTLTQTLSLFPGQTIVVMGTSALDPKTQTISNLFPESFSVSLESTQTGFPHPSQRTGWTLASQLLPEYPQRPDLLREAAQVFICKKQLVEGLSPEGPLVDAAKQMLRVKKQLFALHPQESVLLHRQLAFVMAEAAMTGQLPSEIATCIENFYNALQGHQNPFEWLTNINQCMLDYFIARPHHALLDAVLKRINSDFASQDPLKRYSAAKAILEKSFKEVVLEIKGFKQSSVDPKDILKWDYIHIIGSLVGRAAQSIILQYLSEDLVFQPPVLTPFERRLQATAYAHVIDFQSELSSLKNNQEDAYTYFKAQLESDILRFKQNDFPIVDELAEYFHQRYNRAP